MPRKGFTHHAFAICQSMANTGLRSMMDKTTGASRKERWFTAMTQRSPAASRFS